MRFTKWITELFKDERGNPSVKPVIAFFGAMVLCVSLIIGMISKHKFDPTDPIIQAIVIVTCMAMGGDTADKFSFKSKYHPQEPKPDEPGAGPNPQ